MDISPTSSRPAYSDAASSSVKSRNTESSSHDQDSVTISAEAQARLNQENREQQARIIERAREAARHAERQTEADLLEKNRLRRD